MVYILQARRGTKDYRGNLLPPFRTITMFKNKPDKAELKQKLPNGYYLLIEANGGYKCLSSKPFIVDRSGVLFIENNP